jgi:hypothetical protein
MLADGGELNGVRILSPETVKLMTSNHLPQELMTGKFGGGMHVMRPGFGYGYNCAVITDPGEANLPKRKRHVLLGRCRGNVVLGRSHQRRGVCRHDPAHDEPR